MIFRRICDDVNSMSATELAGFDILGRIPLKDRETGKEYR